MAAADVRRHDEAKRPLEILFVVPQDEQSPGPRYRVFQFLKHYREDGLQPRVMVVQGRSATRRSLSSVHLSAMSRVLHYLGVWLSLQITFARAVTRNRQVDVLYLYRVPVPGWAARILRRGRSRVLFDFDDALDEGDAEPGLFGRLRRRALRRGIENAIATARTTIASNRRNAEAAAALGGSVVVVPTCVDVTRYPFRDRAETPGDGVVVGWVGTPSTAPYLCAIEEVLASLREIIPFRLRLIGAGRNPFRRVEADLRPWSLEREVDEISAFDVGLMPMPDTPWTSGKAALKALQYGASGAPTVASRTESNLEILGPGGGVLFATTPDEWATAVRSLLESPGLRSEIGRRGRAHVCRSYSVDAQLPRLLGVIRGAPVTAGEAGTR